MNPESVSAQVPDIADGVSFSILFSDCHNTCVIKYLSQGAANLQSSIYSDPALGTASLAALYIAVIFSNLFLSVGLIKWLGAKWTIPIGYTCHMPYIAAQMYPSYYTMIPAAILLGLGCGPLWSALFTYISLSTAMCSKLSNIHGPQLLTHFFGIFFMIFSMNQVWGNLISSLVLTTGDNEAAVTSLNETLIPIICGAKFMPSADANVSIPAQPSERIWIVSGVYITFMAGAALIAAVGVDPIKRKHYTPHEPESKLDTMELLVMTLKLMVEPAQLLLIALNVFYGMDMAFFGVDFTAAFVSCAVGTGYVGYVMMVFGLSMCVFSLLLKYLAKVLSSVHLISIATLIHSSILCGILLWRPHAEEVYVIFTIAVLWGLCESIWTIQISAIYAVLCPGREEAAYSTSMIWISVGCIIMYGISPYMIARYKIYLLLTTMIIGVSCYFTVEYLQRRQNKVKRNECLYRSVNVDESVVENEL